MLELLGNLILLAILIADCAVLVDTFWHEDNK